MQTGKGPTQLMQAATMLDNNFLMFARLVREIELLSVESDKGLDRAQAILQQCDTVSQNIGSSMEALSKALEEARDRTEREAQSLTTKVALVRERQQQTQDMLARFRNLGEKVKIVTKAIPELRKPSGGQMSAAESAALAFALPQFTEQVDALVAEAKELMDDAHAANMKVLAKNADSLRQSLQGAHHRLSLFVNRYADKPATPPPNLGTGADLPQADVL